jgi:hypothetical protein
VPGWLVGPLRLEVGHAIYRPARSLHPGRGGRTRLTPRGPRVGSFREVMERLRHSTTVAAVRYHHVMADRDAAIARELNRLIEGG